MNELKAFLGYTYRRDGGEALEEGRYASHADTHIEFYPRCVYAKNPGVYCKHMHDAVLVDFEPTVGSTVWSVVVRYQTGSTFGTIYGEYSIIGIYDSAEKAEAVGKAIRADYKGRDSSYGTFKPPYSSPNYGNGECWKGYFERLEDVDVESLLVK